MGYYIVKMEGHTVRGDFHSTHEAEEWAERVCKSAPWKVVRLKERVGLPHAMKPHYPNVDIPHNVYRPFLSTTN